MEKTGGYFIISDYYAHGSAYGPLLSDGQEYLCPDCGGYKSHGNYEKCPFCKGNGVISFNDKRLYKREKG